MYATFTFDAILTLAYRTSEFFHVLICRESVFTVRGGAPEHLATFFVNRLVDSVA